MRGVIGSATASLKWPSVRFKPIGESCEWMSVYWHPVKKVMLSIYVDDFKMAGPSKEVDLAWKDLAALIDLSEPGEVDAYLGCKHKEHAIEVPEYVHDPDNAGPSPGSGTAVKKQVRYLEYAMEEFIQSCLGKYEELVGGKGQVGVRCHPFP